MTKEEITMYEDLTALRKRQHGTLTIADHLRLGMLERKMEIEASDWAVDQFGNMVHKENGYCIPADRLEECWIEHMSGKTWLKMETFIKAYIRACKIAGVKQVQIIY